MHFLTIPAVIADGLKKLGYKVYDDKEALKNSRRDMPLWVEAARLKNAGTPYGTDEWNKFLGCYDIIVGAFATYFVEDFLSAFYYSKFVVLSATPDSDITSKYHAFTSSPFLSILDSEFFGKIYELHQIVQDTTFDPDQIRASIKIPTNHLEIADFTSWDELCEFISQPKILTPVEKPSANDVAAAFITQWNSLLRKYAEDLILFATFLSMAGSLSMATGQMSRLFFGQTFSPYLLCGITIGLLVLASFVVKNEKPKEAAPAITTTSAPKPAVTPRSGVNPAAYVPPHLRSKKTDVAPARREKKPVKKQGRGGKYSASTPKKVQAGLPLKTTARPVVPGWGDFEAKIKADDRAVVARAVEEAKAFEGVEVEYKTTYKKW
jgi:hypothetical protein